MFCHQCGNPLVENAKFCSVCGCEVVPLEQIRASKLTEAQKKEEIVQPSAEEAFDQELAESEQENEQIIEYEKDKKKKKMLIFVILGLSFSVVALPFVLYGSIGLLTEVLFHYTVEIVSPTIVYMWMVYILLSLPFMVAGMVFSAKAHNCFHAYKKEYTSIEGKAKVTKALLIPAIILSILNIATAGIVILLTGIYFGMA